VNIQSEMRKETIWPRVLNSRAVNTSNVRITHLRRILTACCKCKQNNKYTIHMAISPPPNVSRCITSANIKNFSLTPIPADRGQYTSQVSLSHGHITSTAVQLNYRNPYQLPYQITDVVWVGAAGPHDDCTANKTAPSSPTHQPLEGIYVQFPQFNAPVNFTRCVSTIRQTKPVELPSIGRWTYHTAKAGPKQHFTNNIQVAWA